MLNANSIEHHYSISQSHIQPFADYSSGWLPIMRHTSDLNNNG
jgi:hypothetical protein